MPNILKLALGFAVTVTVAANPENITPEACNLGFKHDDLYNRCDKALGRVAFFAETDLSNMPPAYGGTEDFKSMLGVLSEYANYELSPHCDYWVVNRVKAAIGYCLDTIEAWTKDCNAYRYAHCRDVHSKDLANDGSYDDFYGEWCAPNNLAAAITGAIIDQSVVEC